VNPMGSRMLRRWINRPLRDHAVLRLRHHAVATLLESRRYRAPRESLRGIGDMERALARVALRSARPRDLALLRDALASLPALRRSLAGFDSPLLDELDGRLGDYPDLLALLRRAIMPVPPALIRDGGVIAAGYDEE